MVQEINAWATGCVDMQEWDASFLRHLTYVALEYDWVIGFGDIDETGYLDRLYVHKDFQGRGITTALCNRLEKETGANIITTHASITARQFFEKRGYRVIRQQAVERQGMFLTNYVMQKFLD